MHNYINLNYKPDADDLICTFTVNSSIPLKEAATHIAGESSIDTWSDIKTLKPSIIQRLKPNVFYINTQKNKIKIAYPSELFESGNIPQIMSSIAGNIFGLKPIISLRLEDISFPRVLIKSFLGPAFGIEGIRKLTKIKERPLIGTIIKPKLGLTSKEHAELAYKSWIGGCDIVKDDENLTNQKFNPFNERIKLTVAAKEKAEKETGEKKIYMPNITAPYKEMLERAEFVKKQGNEYIMIDILTAGFSAVQSIRNENLRLVIHAHRAMHAALTKKPNGISMLSLAKLARLSGVDQLHIGTAVGKMEGSISEIQEIKNSLEENLFGLKSTLSVCSGGLSPNNIPDLIKLLGNNIVIQSGGGIHAHPKGSFSGAKALRQAIDSALKGIPIKEYSKSHEELKLSLNIK